MRGLIRSPAEWGRARIGGGAPSVHKRAVMRDQTWRAPHPKARRFLEGKTIARPGRSPGAARMKCRLGKPGFFRPSWTNSGRSCLEHAINVCRAQKRLCSRRGSDAPGVCPQPSTLSGRRIRPNRSPRSASQIGFLFSRLARNRSRTSIFFQNLYIVQFVQNKDRPVNEVSP